MPPEQGDYAALSVRMMRVKIATLRAIFLFFYPRHVILHDYRDMLQKMTVLSRALAGLRKNNK